MRNRLTFPETRFVLYRKTGKTGPGLPAPGVPVPPTRAECRVQTQRRTFKSYSENKTTIQIFLFREDILSNLKTSVDWSVGKIPQIIFFGQLCTSLFFSLKWDKFYYLCNPLFTLKKKGMSIS